MPLQLLRLIMNKRRIYIASSAKVCTPLKQHNLAIYAGRFMSQLSTALYASVRARCY